MNCAARISRFLPRSQGISRNFLHTAQLAPFTRSVEAASSECGSHSFLSDFVKSYTSFAARSFHSRTTVFAKEKAMEECASPIFNVQDESDFKKRVLESKVPVVVDFHASWCGPCKILGPRLEALISEKKGQINMAKVDIDANDELASQYSVRSVPTVLAVKDGKVVDQFIGLKDDDQIKNILEKLLH